MERRRALITMLALWLAATAIYSFGQRYGDEPVVVDNVRFYVRADRQEAFAAEVVWDGASDSIVYTVPDTVEGAPVKAIGGLAGSGFKKSPYSGGVTMPETYRGAERWHSGLPAQAREITVPIFLHIGRYVREVGDIAGTTSPVGYYGWAEETESVILLPEWYVTCDEHNPFFYAEDGCLYRRADNTRLALG